MKPETVRGAIALVVVGGVVLTSAILALVPLLSDYEEARATPYYEFVKTYTGIFSGIVGLVFGYYFGRAGTGRSDAQGGDGGG